jgi:hypothetical protein
LVYFRAQQQRDHQGNFQIHFIGMLEGGEKENFLTQTGDRNPKTVEQLEKRERLFNHLQTNLFMQRIGDEMPLIRSEREDRLHEMYYNGNDPHAI